MFSIQCGDAPWSRSFSGFIQKALYKGTHDLTKLLLVTENSAHYVVIWVK